MASYRLGPEALLDLKEIYAFTQRGWNEKQADRYLEELFGKFEAIGIGKAPSRPIPSKHGVVGRVCRHRRHVIYWRLMDDGKAAIMTVMHERMLPDDRLKAAFEA